MLSFIRKRLPSKDRSHEHLQNAKSTQIQHEHQDDDIKRTQSANELNVHNDEKRKKKKKKKKEKSSLSVNELVIGSPSCPSSTINRINESYSDVDYVSMMPGPLSQSVNHDKTSKNCESVQTTSDINYLQTTVIKPRVFQIPIIDCRKEQRILSYKDVDHQRTKALREVTEQRTQQKLIK